MKALLRGWSRVDELLQRIERGILVTGILTILVVGVLDLALRTVFQWGLGFADTLARQITIWLGLFGGTLATSAAEHINIDAFSRLLNRQKLIVNRILVSVACILVSGFLTYFAIRLVSFYYAAPNTVVEMGHWKIPTWWLLLSFPIAFGVMTSRYLLHTFEYLYALRGDPLPWSLVTEKLEEELLQRDPQAAAQEKTTAPPTATILPTETSAEETKTAQDGEDKR